LQREHDYENGGEGSEKPGAFFHGWSPSVGGGGCLPMEAILLIPAAADAVS
jgi:hypothetical protein